MPTAYLLKIHVSYLTLFWTYFYASSLGMVPIIALFWNFVQLQPFCSTLHFFYTIFSPLFVVCSNVICKHVLSRSHTTPLLVFSNEMKSRSICVLRWRRLCRQGTKKSRWHVPWALLRGPNSSAADEMNQALFKRKDQTKSKLRVKKKSCSSNL